MGRRRGGAGAPQARPSGSGSCARCPTATIEELSPRLGRASGELAALGIPAEAALDVAADLRKHSDAVAKTFVNLFIRQIWRPFEDRGSPENDLPAVGDAIERLRPLASDALLAMFQLVMTEVVEDRIGREVERIQRKRR